MFSCTLYSNQVGFDAIVDLVKAALPKAAIETPENPQVRSLVATIKGGLFSRGKTLKINYRQRAVPSYKLDRVECPLTQNLAGMVNLVGSLPARNAVVRDKFMMKIMATNSEMAFIVEPGMTEEFDAVLRRLLAQLDAFVFAQPGTFSRTSSEMQFLDRDLRLILDTAGNTGIDDLEVRIDAAYHDSVAPPADVQLARKARSEEWLRAHNVPINPNLPCVESEEGIQLRSVSDVVGRAYALLIVGAIGQGVAVADLEASIREQRITSFSPEELALLQMAELGEQERIKASWQYESLNVLLWALGKFDALGYPADVCNVQAVLELMLKSSRDEFERDVRLRSAADVLDELDRTYRMNWACVDARIHGRPAPGNLHPSVVYERHYALNWLTGYEGWAWDDVQTPT